MSIGLIADHMKIRIEKANAFCNAMIKYGITERANGMIVVQEGNMEYRSAIVNETGHVMFWCDELQGEEQIECILNGHPEWKLEYIEQQGGKKNEIRNRNDKIL